MSYAEYLASQQQVRNTRPERNPTSATSTPQSSSISMRTQMDVENLVEEEGRVNITKLDETLKTGTWFGYKNKITKRILWMFQTTMDEAYTKYCQISETKKSHFSVLLRKNSLGNHSHVPVEKEMEEWRNGEDPPSHLAGKKAWDDLITYRKTDKAIKNSTTNSKNRNSTRDGKGPATHNGGARSIKQRIVDLTNELGGEPDSFTMLKDRYTNKKTRVISDPVVADYVSKIEEAANIRCNCYFV